MIVCKTTRYALRCNECCSKIGKRSRYYHISWTSAKRRQYVRLCVYCYDDWEEFVIMTGSKFYYYGKLREEIRRAVTMLQLRSNHRLVQTWLPVHLCSPA